MMLHRLFASQMFKNAVRCPSIASSSFSSDVQVKCLREMPRPSAICRAFTSFPRAHQLPGRSLLAVAPTSLDCVRANHQVRIERMDKDMTEEMICEHFSQCGFSPLEVKIKDDEDTGNRNGLISFSTRQEFEYARAHHRTLNTINGKKMSLQFGSPELTLFLRGLSPSAANEECVQQHFEQFGPVYKCFIPFDHKKKVPVNRGCVIFQSKEGLQKAVDACPHSIGGAMINVIVANKNQKSHTIVISNLPTTTTEEAVCDALSKFGRIIGCSVRSSKDADALNAFVNFDSEKAVRDAVKSGSLVIEDKEVDVEMMTRVYHTREHVRDKTKKEATIQAGSGSESNNVAQ